MLLLCLVQSLYPGAAARADDAEDPARLFVALDQDGHLLPLSIEEKTFDAILDLGTEDPIRQAWHYNIYSQFYFPGEDPQIDHTFLGNRRYPRLLQKLAGGAALIWVNTAATRGDAGKLRDELARQGLEGAFVARARGDYHHSHTAEEQAQLQQLAGKLAANPSRNMSAYDWLAGWDRQRRFGMQVHLLYLDNVPAVNEALRLHDMLAKELGHCGMLNRPQGGYRLFCGAYESRDELLEAYRRLAELSGMHPTTVCIRSNGNAVHWSYEDPSSW